ncbi:MAG: hypothetical protein J6W98_01290 [Bacteroidales bacterium]|nr:hypothetical protein [Bacteroidales bacterium]
MKKFLMAAALLLTVLSAKAQEYSTAWPYLYQTFTDGSVVLKGGTKFQQPLNIHILHSALHYLEEGLVKEAKLEDVLSVQIGKDSFMNVGGQMMKILASSESGSVCELALGDFERLLEGTGAYGTSSVTSATRKLSSLEIAGSQNQNHMEMWESRHGGERVNLVKKTYLVLPGNFFEASRRGIEATLDDAQKASFKQWLKSHKVKWNDPASVLTVAEFFSK